MTRLRKIGFLAMGFIAAAGMGSTAVKAQDPPPLYSSVDELPQLDGFNIDFVQAEDRAMTIEDGLEFFEALGTWGVYQVTSANPRLYMPGVVAGSYGRHRTVMCGSSGFFTDGGDFGLTLFELRLVGVRESGEQLLATDSMFAFDVPGCSSTGDRLGAAPGDEPIGYTYIEFLDPVPPIGSLIPLRMVGVDSPGSDVPHDSARQICCIKDDCGLDEPPGGWPPPGSYCGDGTVDAGEVCDDGANNGLAGFCKVDCTGPVEPPGGGGDCGDGTVDAGEMCDDGANNGQPGFCKADCTGPVEPPGGGGSCGDGIVDADEMCDDGANNGQPGFCRIDCTLPNEPTGANLPDAVCATSSANTPGHADLASAVTLLLGLTLRRRRRSA